MPVKFGAHISRVLGCLTREGAYITVIGVALFGPFAAPVAADTTANIGISTSATLLRMSNRDLDARLNDIQHLGATWIRIDFSWPAVQPDNARIYHWSMYDRIVRIAGKHHLKILAVLDYTPKWAQEPRCARLVITSAAATKCNPANNNLAGRFARAAAIRYKGKGVYAWEIWNEPNLSAYWKVAQPSGAVLTSSLSYAALANSMALQIRRNDPQALIITGGLSPMFHPRYPKGISQGDFLSQILSHLQPNLFDGVGVHPYSWPVLPTTAAVYNAFYTVNHGPADYNLRAIMVKNGWGSKQIWGTEFGAPTKGVSAVAIPTLYSRPDHVTEALQAQIITQGIQSWYSIPNNGPLFVQSDSDHWLPQTKNEGGFGLRRSNGTEKPAYTADKAAAMRH
jgi:hypothetical protein